MWLGQGKTPPPTPSPSHLNKSHAFLLTRGVADRIGVLTIVVRGGGVEHGGGWGLLHPLLQLLHERRHVVGLRRSGPGRRGKRLPKKFTNKLKN